MIVPIFKDKKELDEISSVVDSIISKFEGSNVEIKFDNSDKLRPGAKFAKYELEGVPVRIVIGPNDLKNKSLEIFRRDELSKEIIPLDNVKAHVLELLDEIQINLYKKSFKL